MKLTDQVPLWLDICPSKFYSIFALQRARQAKGKTGTGLDEHRATHT